jgi:hypothetical protein
VGRRVKQSRIAEGFEKFVDRRVDDESVWWSWQSWAAVVQRGKRNIFPLDRK